MISGPYDVRMSGAGVFASSWGNGPDSATIDFERRLFTGTLLGEHYMGALEPVQDRPGNFRFIATAPSGAKLDCYVSPLYEKAWSGGCRDEGGRLIELRLGREFHV